MRAWIIGNGPSLRETPLHLLHKEPLVYGMNLVNLAYQWTEWRPTHYIKHEWEDRKRGLQSMVDHINMRIPCYINGLFFPRLFPNIPAYWPPLITPITTVCHHSGANAFHGIQPTAWHLPRICCFASTVGVAAQIAVLEKADELVFVGCDLGYKWFNKLAAGDPNHFDGSYGEADMFPIEERDLTLILMHNIIKAECDARGIKAWNATVGGQLEVYPRRSIEDIING